MSYLLSAILFLSALNVQAADVEMGGPPEVSSPPAASAPSNPTPTTDRRSFLSSCFGSLVLGAVGAMVSEGVRFFVPKFTNAPIDPYWKKPEREKQGIQAFVSTLVKAMHEKGVALEMHRSQRRHLLENSDPEKFESLRRWLPEDLALFEMALEPALKKALPTTSPSGMYVSVPIVVELKYDTWLKTSFECFVAEDGYIWEADELPFSVVYLTPTGVKGISVEFGSEFSSTAPSIKINR